jgi:hypothetical protein
MPNQIEMLVMAATTMDRRTGMLEEKLAWLQAGHARKWTRWKARDKQDLDFASEPASRSSSAGFCNFIQITAFRALCHGLNGRPFTGMGAETGDFGQNSLSKSIELFLRKSH